VAGVSLRVISGSAAGRSVGISGTVVIGPDPGLDLTLEDERVSRKFHKSVNVVRFSDNPSTRGMGRRGGEPRRPVRCLLALTTGGGACRLNL
jgi:hypothetical protein